MLDPTQPFDIKVDWKIDGNIAELWLSALAVASPDWVVTAYAESVGPGFEKILVAQNVPVLPLPSANRRSPTRRRSPCRRTPSTRRTPVTRWSPGVYKLVVTVFLDSTFGSPGYDIMGFAEGPVIKVENPSGTGLALDDGQRRSPASCGHWCWPSSRPKGPKDRHWSASRR